MKNSKKENILTKLKKSINNCGCLNQEEFLQIKKMMFPKLGINFELFENDVYQKHIESNKYVFLEKHPSCPDFFNSRTKTFGSLIEADGLMAMFLLQNIYKGKVRFNLQYPTLQLKQNGIYVQWKISVFRWPEQFKTYQ